MQEQDHSQQTSQGMETASPPENPASLSPSKLPRKQRIPKNHKARWRQLVELVDSGLTWTESFKRTFPEISDKKEIYKSVENLRKNKSFQTFLKGRAIQVAKDSKMTKAELLDHWVQIAEFNTADLFEDSGEGTVRLQYNWLETAKKRNVIHRIVVTKKTITTKSGDEITTETTDVIPYSRVAALIRLGKLLGYDESSKAPAATQIQQSNNLYLVAQIEAIQDAIKRKSLPVNGRIPEAPVIDAEFVEKMMKVEIVDDRKENQ